MDALAVDRGEMAIRVFRVLDQYHDLVQYLLERQIPTAEELAMDVDLQQGLDLPAHMRAVEKNIITQYLVATGGNRRATAKLLRLPRTTLIDKLRQLGITTIEEREVVSV